MMTRLSISVVLIVSSTLAHTAEKVSARKAVPTSARVCAEENVSVPFPETAAAITEAGSDRTLGSEARRWFCGMVSINPDVRTNPEKAANIDFMGAGVLLEYFERRATIGIKELEISQISSQFQDARCYGDGPVRFPKAKKAAMELASQMKAWSESAKKLDQSSRVQSDRQWAAEKDFKVSKDFADLAYVDFCLAAVQVAGGMSSKLKKLDDESFTVLSVYIGRNVRFAPLLRPDARTVIEELVPLK